MSHPGVALLESALRARKLDRTLTTAWSSSQSRDIASCTQTGVAALDECLRGGLPRGELSELAGARSSGRTTLLFQLFAAATRQGEIVASIDTFDRLDVASVVAAGVDLDRFLWIRGQAITRPPGSDTKTPIERALKALNLVLQAGGFSVVAIDLADVPTPVLKQVPFTTWMRIQRTIEGSTTACVLVVAEPLARSAGGLTLSLSGRTKWTGAADRSRRLAGIDVTTTVISPRRRVNGEATIEAMAFDVRAGL